MSGRTAILAAGLAWLYETEQPDDAILQHHGETLSRPDSNRWYGFCPAGWDGRVVISTHVGKVEWTGEGGGRRPANPLGPGELDAITAELAGLGAEVVSTWNGHPGTTGSLALARPAHPTLLAAVDRYRRGCPNHTGPLCSWDGCPWYPTGNARVAHLKDIAAGAAGARVGD
ncbi:hypothetical protein [Streptomyces synnematoformans]|uniref:Uncharacterized protein n=1 Tax=Streptomyces synnematoformans TaxID=415721 RepID=A0ABN2XBJ4_9ACTN